MPQYMFMVPSIYQHQGLLTSGGKEIKHKTEILALLKILHKPAKVSIIHCPGHQKGDFPVARGNNLANQKARAVALRVSSVMVVRDPGSSGLKFWYSAEDLAVISKNPNKHFDQEKELWKYAIRKKDSATGTSTDNDKTNASMDPPGR